MFKFGLAPFYIHQMNQVNSCNGFCHDDSTINIVLELLLFLRRGTRATKLAQLAAKLFTGDDVNEEVVGADNIKQPICHKTGLICNV